MEWRVMIALWLSWFPLSARILVKEDVCHQSLMSWGLTARKTNVPMWADQTMAMNQRGLCAKMTQVVRRTGPMTGMNTGDECFL